MGKRDFFSEQVEPLHIVYTVHGEIDNDGLVDITEVTIGDSIINLWPDLNETYVGDQIQDECNEIIAKRRQSEESWSYDDTREAA